MNKLRFLLIMGEDYDAYIERVAKRATKTYAARIWEAHNDVIYDYIPSHKIDLDDKEYEEIHEDLCKRIPYIDPYKIIGDKIDE